MPTAAKIMLLIAVAATIPAVVLLVQLGVLGQGPAAPGPLDPDDRVTDLRILPFRMTDQAGREIDESVFLGRLTVVDFIFTHCPFVCPTLTSVMAEVADRHRHPSVQFLSISVDPEHDTPERLRAYAAEYGADTTRWRFATGDRASTWRMISEGLLFAIEPDPTRQVALPGGGTMENILHPSWFVLVGPEGRVLGIYGANDDAAVAELERRLRRGVGVMQEARG